MGKWRGVYMVLVGKPEGKRPLGRHRCRWEDNIKINLQEVGCGGIDWIQLAQDRGHVAGICECGNEPSGFIKFGFESHSVAGKSVVFSAFRRNGLTELQWSSSPKKYESDLCVFDEEDTTFFKSSRVTDTFTRRHIRQELISDNHRDHRFKHWL
jgi:hypothetical protein